MDRNTARRCRSCRACVPWFAAWPHPARWRRRDGRHVCRPRQPDDPADCTLTSLSPAAVQLRSSRLSCGPTHSCCRGWEEGAVLRLLIPCVSCVTLAEASSTLTGSSSTLTPGRTTASVACVRAGWEAEGEGRGRGAEGVGAFSGLRCACLGYCVCGQGHYVVRVVMCSSLNQTSCGVGHLAPALRQTLASGPVMQAREERRCTQSFGRF
mmetsp:Transcript_2583/g.6936  ORF Transcript_2583/g.6936 Transcript_2583/m.6936 type:complete len:210 (+) Transcript_2583:4781-5410(+)